MRFLSKGNQVKISVAKGNKRRLANPGCISDSWRMTFFLNSHAAIHKGNDTYPHLPNTTSIRYFHIYHTHCTTPKRTKKKSRMFFRHAHSHKYLLSLPDKMGRKMTSSKAFACSSSIDNDAPTQYIWLHFSLR